VLKEGYPTQKIKLGLIGLGYIGKIHLRDSFKLNNVDLVAVSDLSRRALNDARKAGVKKTYNDYEQLLRDPQIDAVIIALPTHLHLDSAKKAAEAKKHILLEKPIAKNVAEAKEIVASAQRNSVKLMIGYPLRFNTLMYNLREKLNTGELGDIVAAYATNVGTGPFMHRSHGYAPVPVPDWWFDKTLTGGGALIDLGSHMINLLRWYFGEIVEVKSHLGYRYNMDFEDHATCFIKFKSGTTATINVGWFSQKYQLKVELLGTVDHAIANNIPPNRIIAAAQMLLLKNSVFWQPYIAELCHFARSVANDLQPHPTGIDGLRDIEAIETAYKNTRILDF
jgi:predicted dehydrogenase